MNANRIFTPDQIAELIRRPTLLPESEDDGMVLKASLVVFGPKATGGGRRMESTIRPDKSIAERRPVERLKSCRPVEGGGVSAAESYRSLERAQ